MSCAGTSLLAAVPPGQLAPMAARLVDAAWKEHFAMYNSNFISCDTVIAGVAVWKLDNAQAKLCALRQLAQAYPLSKWAVEALVQPPDALMVNLGMVSAAF